MRRRDFVLTFGGLAASAWPVIVSAQQRNHPLLGSWVPERRWGWNDWTNAFQQRIRNILASTSPGGFQVSSLDSYSTAY